MLISKRTIDVASTTGLKMPRRVFGPSSLSTSSVTPTRSDRIRPTASFFSSAVSHRAVSGRSVRVKKATSDRPIVMMPRAVGLDAAAL